MRSPRTALALLLALAVPLAGCLDAPRDSAPGAATAGDHGRDDASMSASESVMEDGGVSTGIPPGYEVRRVVTVEGRLALDRLPVTLSTVNGAVAVSPGREGEWRLVVTMVGRGVTEAEAREQLDRMELTWAHERDGEHFVEAHVKERRQSDAGSGSRSASIALEMPPSALLTLALSTVNGAVDVSSVRADDVTASTTNGAVSVEASGTRNVHVSTTNGGISAALMPESSGTVTASVVNGAIEVRVPEGARYGYDATASTVNGDASVDLEDGTARESGGFGGRSATFQTSGYASRDVRVTVSLSGTNGDVRLAPL